MTRQRNTKIVTESYRIQKLEEQIAKKLKVVMHELGAWRAESGKPVEVKDHLWHISQHDNYKRRNEIEFSDYRYDPKSSKMVYGDTVVISEDKEEVDGFSRILRNKVSPVDTEVTISETVGLSNEVSNEFNQEYHFDVTSNTTVTGSYGGAEIESSLEVSFGTSFEVNKSELEIKSKEQTIEQVITIPAGIDIQVAFEKNAIKTEQPFTVKGVLDFSLLLNFENWSQSKYLFVGDHYGQKRISFSNMLELEQFFEGYNTDYPDMRDFLTDCSQKCYDAYSWIVRGNNRTIEAVGVKKRTYDDNVSIITREL